MYDVRKNKKGLKIKYGFAALWIGMESWKVGKLGKSESRKAGE